MLTDTETNDMVNGLLPLIQKADEVIYFRPEPQLRIYHPAEDNLFILAPKLIMPKWLLCLFADDGDRLFVRNDGAEPIECDSKIVKDAFFAVPVAERRIKHPYEDVRFWKKIMRTLARKGNR